MLLSFAVVFAGENGDLRVSAIIAALANVVAVGLTALPIWWLCRRVSWQRGDRWWFLPMHFVAALLASQLWLYVLAFCLAISEVLQGRMWDVAPLAGPARVWQAFTAVFLYTAVAATVYAVQAVRAVEQATALHYQSEMAALRAQLDPHLLFNTLHSLLELVRSGDARADDAVERFARVTRYVTKSRVLGDDLVPLAEEWRMVEDYLSLEALRLGPRFTYSLRLDPAIAQQRLPAMTLQPLVENAIVHGIGPRTGPGRLDVRGESRGGRVVITVTDDGTPDVGHTAGSGQGLRLVERRLLLRYGDAATFEAGPRGDGPGWRVVMTYVPLPSAREDSPHA
ncbi:MAG: sensor histidine kinase [Gemmatimonadaceae bacterium]